MRGKRWRLAALAAVLFAANANAQTIQFHSGIAPSELSRAQVVRVGHGVRIQDLATLRNDQFIEAPSGRRVQVGKFRQLLIALQQAKLRTSRPRRAEFTILPPAKGPGVARRPGETAAQLLARPPTDVIRMKNGHTVSVAQLRLIAPYVERKYGVSLSGGASTRPPLNGPAITIVSLAQLRSIPASTPDSTVLMSPQGTRITLGELRAALKSRPEPTFLHSRIVRTAQ